MIQLLCRSLSIRERIRNLADMRAVDLVSSLKALRRKRDIIQNEQSRRRKGLLGSLLQSIFLLPVTVTYFFWIYIPLLVYTITCAYVILFLQIVSKRSKHTKRLLLHISALSKIGKILLDPQYYTW